MARMTIYIPDELKARIDAVKDEVVWSDVACRAFQIKLGEIANFKKEKDMKAVVERLRASKLKNEDETAIQGREDGRWWAENFAEFAQLKRLSEIDMGEFVAGEPNAPWTHSLLLAAEILGDRKATKLGEAVAFWKDDVQCEGDAYEDEDYIDGFVDGALRVFEQVQNAL